MTRFRELLTECSAHDLATLIRMSTDLPIIRRLLADEVDRRMAGLVS
jgi:hypothetical protein